MRRKFHLVRILKIRKTDLNKVQPLFWAAKSRILKITAAHMTIQSVVSCSQKFTKKLECNPWFSNGSGRLVLVKWATTAFGTFKPICKDNVFLRYGVAVMNFWSLGGISIFKKAVYLWCLERTNNVGIFWLLLGSKSLSTSGKQVAGVEERKKKQRVKRKSFVDINDASLIELKRCLKVD